MWGNKLQMCALDALSSHDPGVEICSGCLCEQWIRKSDIYNVHINDVRQTAHIVLNAWAFAANWDDATAFSFRFKALCLRVKYEDQVGSLSYRSRSL